MSRQRSQGAIDEGSLTPRQELLDAAARLLAEGGLEGLTTRRLATEVGTSTMGVYTWFGSKPSLMRALFREGFARFGDYLNSPEPTGDPLTDLRAMGVAYRAFALDNPNFYEIMFGRSAGVFTPDDDDIAFSLSTLTILINAVAACVESGAITGEPLALSLQMWAAVHGAVSLELSLGGERPLFAGGAVFDALIDSLFTGMRSRTSA